MREKIEIGDVFRWRRDGVKRRVTSIVRVGGNAETIGSRGEVFRLDECDFEKADPYHGITLPESIEKLVATMQDRGYTVEKVQPPLKSWQFRHEPWVPKQPETLADVPENFDVVCTIQGHGELCVLRRVSMGAYATTGDKATYMVGSASKVKFVRYLDHLDDVPDGRCVMLDGQYAWRAFRESNGWLTQFPNGTIREVTPTDPPEITDYIAEFR